jgi:cytochrome c5
MRFPAYLAAFALLAAAPAIAAVQEPPAPQPAPAPTPQPQGTPDAKAILESACTSCHGLDFITEKRKDRPDWEFTVNQMISRGADLNPDEAAAVIDYLAKTYPRTPAADAKPQG